MKTCFPNVFFDLDGTLTDSAPGILNSCAYALEHMGIFMAREELYTFIGPPLLETFTRLVGTPAGGAEAVRLYREYFSSKGIFENSVYPGVEEMLADLQEAGCRNILATAKPLVFARRILDHFGLTRYFSYIGGASLDGYPHNKHDVLADNLRQTGVRPASVLMVGDRRDDVDAAHALNVRCAAVRYGYADEGEIEHADWLCRQPRDVVLVALTGYLCV